jgi:hypothetical protein
MSYAVRLIEAAAVFLAAAEAEGKDPEQALADFTREVERLRALPREGVSAPRPAGPRPVALARSAEVREDALLRLRAAMNKTAEELALAAKARDFGDYKRLKAKEGA